MNYSLSVQTGSAVAQTYNFLTSAERDAFALALHFYAAPGTTWSVLS